VLANPTNARQHQSAIKVLQHSAIDCSTQQVRVERITWGAFHGTHDMGHERGVGIVPFPASNVV